MLSCWKISGKRMEKSAGNCKAGQPGKIGKRAEQARQMGKRAGRFSPLRPVSGEDRKRGSLRGRLENTRRRLRCPPSWRLYPPRAPNADDSPSLGCLPRRSPLLVTTERCSLRLGQSVSSMALRALARQRT